MDVQEVLIQDQAKTIPQAPIKVLTKEGDIIIGVGHIFVIIEIHIYLFLTR